MPQKPDYRVTAETAPNRSGETRLAPIGVGFHNQKSGSISLYLDALPVSSRIVIFPNTDEEEQSQ